MGIFNLSIYLLKFFIPSFYSVLFRGYGLGYKSKKHFALGLCLVVVYMAVVPTFFILTLGYGQFTHLSTVIMTLGSMLVLVFSTDSVGKTIFLQLTQSCMTTMLSVVLNLIRTVFSLSYPTLVLMLAVVCPVVYWIALRCWAKPLRFMADNLHADLPATLALPVITICVVYFLPVYPAQSFASHPVFISAMMLAVEAAYLLYIYTLYRNLRKMNELAKAEMRSRLLESEILSYQEYLQAAKESRHDLRHHNAVLLEYLAQGDADKAIAYLSGSEKQLEDTALKQFCENTTANAIFRIYDRRAQAAGIALLVRAEVPERMPLCSPELGAVLSNLLENAMEACQAQTLSAHIAVFAELSENRWQLEVRNSAAADVVFENGFPKSTKQGGGTGTKSVAAIVESHAGLLRFQQKNHEFIVQILLPLKTE